MSKLFDVCSSSTLEEMEQQDEVKVAWGTGIAGHVAESGEPVNIPDAYQVRGFGFIFVRRLTVDVLLQILRGFSGGKITEAKLVNNGVCGLLWGEILKLVFWDSN